MGYLRLQREDYRGAAEAFEGCLKYRPAWPEAHANLALAYAGLGERDHAERLYEKMLDGDPKKHGRAARSGGPVHPSQRFRYRAGIPRAPDRSRRAVAGCAVQRRPDVRKGRSARKAVRFYRDALAQQADMPEALLNLGRILESNGKGDEARTCWNKALEAEPALAQGYFGPAID